MSSPAKRQEFRENCLERDNHTCVIPWCSEEVTEDPDEPGEVHHIFERKLWEADHDGYIQRNGATVCNYHHRQAERKNIPPQAFFRWTREKPIAPEGVDALMSDKWGEEYEDKPSEHREYIKYPSTGHLPFSPVWDGTRVDFTEVDDFLHIPLVVTIKLDGSNASLRRDKVVARNGTHAQQEQYDYLKKMHKEIAHEIPENLQICGEWLYAKHSIHYGCDCEDSDCDEAPALRSYFQVFGVYDREYNIWLSWDKVEEWADKLGFPTVPVLRKYESYSQDYEVSKELEPLAEEQVEKGHEGIVIRPRLPFHYGEFSDRIGKYVRENHIQTDEHHWKKGNYETNNLRD